MSVTHVIPNTTVFAVTDPDEALANYALNNCFGNVVTLSDGMREATLLELARKCDPQFVGQLAIYAYTTGKLRDVGALLTAYILPHSSLFEQVAPKTLNNIGQIRKFVSYIRSGLVGRKSLGSVAKRYIQKFLAGLTHEELFIQSIGSNPSIGDVIKLAHPKPTTEQASTFKYLLGRDVPFDELPEGIQAYQRFVKGEYSVDALPSVPVQMLQPHLKRMTPAQKLVYVSLLSPNQARRELNTLQRAGALESEDAQAAVVAKITRLGGKNTTLPLSLYNTTRNLQGIPHKIGSALVSQFSQILFDAAGKLDSQITRPLTLALDCSGSMRMNYVKISDRTDPVDCFTAGLIFAYGLSKNPLVHFITVDTSVHQVPAFREAKTFAEFQAAVPCHGGGTALSEVLRNTCTPDTIIISDNESWRDTHLATHYWAERRDAVKRDMPRLVLWDIQPNRRTPVCTESEVLNISGLSEGVYDTIAGFFDFGDSLISQIKNIQL